MKFRYAFIFFVAVLFSKSALAQQVFSPYYVVIGGFKSEANAQKYCMYAQEQNLPAVYAFNEERQIFYVYVRSTQTKEVADDIQSRLRSASVFKDAWVFNGVLSGSNLAKKQQAPPTVKTVEPEPQRPVITQESAPMQKEPQGTKSGAAPQPTNAVVETAKPIGKPFVFKLLNGETGNVVNGLVRLQETDKASQFRGFNGNEKVYIPAPTNRAGKWYVVCQVLGFRQFKKPVVYDKAQELEGASVGSDQEIILPLELQRVRKGDYIEMENVKFYNNSALFSPGSERELDELVAMMTENPDYQIRLHGHTNGKEPRDIVTLGTSTDFFTPNLSNAKSQASSKELSLFRAELVKSYLTSKGVDAVRISTKGEGGTQMIFEPSGTLAGLNDRVEVEIRKN
jgi:outer membrane protein OmpA-like peptidoglycan-associated protein